MRRWLFLVMVLLLPLRGLVGDAMAAQMMQHAGPAAAAAAAAPHHAQGLALPGHDCNDQHHAQAQPSEAPTTAADATGSGDCPTCASCQVCSSVALSPSSAAARAGHASQPPPEVALRTFTSAEPALTFKPPRG